MDTAMAVQEVQYFRSNVKAKCLGGADIDAKGSPSPFPAICAKITMICTERDKIHCWFPIHIKWAKRHNVNALLSFGQMMLLFACHLTGKAAHTSIQIHQKCF